MLSFIETQFPVSKLSKESYKERRANFSQTLTVIGKWWGRKPLILVRAAIFGLLLPTSTNLKKDREIFLKILTMDEEGLWLRKSQSIPLKIVYSYLNAKEREKFFSTESTPIKRKFNKGIKKSQKEELQKIVFNRLSYDEKLKYCDRPEQIDGPSKQAWEEINAHLGTTANSLSELVSQLGNLQFGRVPRVGDAMCGGGSVPFEAARIGCQAYGSDLNPVAALLTWASLNIVGGGFEVAEQFRRLQRLIFDAVDQQIKDWDIEQNQQGWRADAYLYCHEVTCPECGWKVPLAPSWIIAAGYQVIVKLIPNSTNKCFDFEIEMGVSESELRVAKESGTVKSSSLVCPHCYQKTPMTMIRGDRRFANQTQYGLRLWENEDLVPRSEDVFQERLYCIRWIKTYYDAEGKKQIIRNYLPPDEEDLAREEKVLNLLRERFYDWQEKGYIPNRRIESGYNTDQPIRERGWTHWHHLFNPRQLLLHGTMLAEIFELQGLTITDKVGLLLRVGSCLNWNSKLCIWNSDASKYPGSTEQTFVNQALNTQYNYGIRTVLTIEKTFFGEELRSCECGNNKVQPADARSISEICDYWITDPAYADAVNYHELSEFFLSYYEKHIPRLFTGWYSDSKRALAVIGSQDRFRKSMVECYQNLTKRTSENGVQIVMFTHQDASVWADLALILWASGLRVTAAWCIATETDSGLKEGNYVQGTVLLVLRKQTSEDTAFLDELYPEVEIEVKAQLDSMLALEDNDDPNFSDTDYQLAAYAAALRVLTQYKNIEDFDIAYELSKPRKNGETSEIEKLIADAVKIACDYLVPKGFDSFIWKSLTPEEKFYLKGLDIETHGEYRSGAYQELARGFGIKEYKSMLDSGKANETRLKTASEFAAKQLGDIGFGASLVRNTLFAIREIVRTEETQKGKTWLRTEIKDYWNQRKNIIEILHFLSAMGLRLPHWKTDADAARLLAGAVENDSI
ncbi:MULTISPECIES: anti-phage-associated DUF1156 domain-containing protein [unclassified Microcoleus]|uniref:anti-phage-associated DUF1156 domain-containing protein n=1 Tax=unclassified Microcoleus TaxID=2642155 RepID=UPI002FD3B665